MSSIKLIFGGAIVGRFPPAQFQDEESVKALLDSLQRQGIIQIDTAQGYHKGTSEELLGLGGGTRRFIVDTKFPGGFSRKPSTSENVVTSGRASLERLRTPNVNIYYLHAPDPRVPLAETLAGVQALYETGAFDKFGLSNFDAQGVEAVHELCKANGYVFPTVCQLNYNAFARRSEDELFPLLRRLQISCYAYSPLAGGFLTKSKADIEAGAGRFNKSFPMVGELYTSLYCKPELVDALVTWASIAEGEGCSPADLAHRWLQHHSALKSEHEDGIIFGARNHAQLENTLQGFRKGPLDPQSVQRIDELWTSIRDVAPMDTFHH